MSSYAHCDNCGLATKDEAVMATWYAVVGPENRPQPVNILALFGAAPKQAPLEFCSAKCVGAYFLLLGVAEEAQASGG